MVYEWVAVKNIEKWETEFIEHGIWGSCTEKHRQWETHHVEQGI